MVPNGLFQETENRFTLNAAKWKREKILNEEKVQNGFVNQRSVEIFTKRGYTLHTHSGNDNEIYLHYKCLTRPIHLG